MFHGCASATFSSVVHVSGTVYGSRITPSSSELINSSFWRLISSLSLFSSVFVFVSVSFISFTFIIVSVSASASVPMTVFGIILIFGAVSGTAFISGAIFLSGIFSESIVSGAFFVSEIFSGVISSSRLITSSSVIWVPFSFDPALVPTLLSSATKYGQVMLVLM